MVVCSVNDFLEKLVPFWPDAHWIDSTYDHLKEEKLLQTPTEATLRAKTAPQRNIRAGSRTRAEAGALGYEIGARVCPMLVG
jgi:hypothetical protein